MIAKEKGSQDILVRSIRKSDFEQLFKLITEGFQKEISIVGLDSERLQRMQKLYLRIRGFLTLLEFFHIDFESILVAVSGDKLVGEIHMVPHGKGIWSLDSAAVDRNFRGRGIYRRLMREALDYIRKKHGKRILTSLWTDNIAPIRITSELQYNVFATETLMLYEFRSRREKSHINADERILIRDVRPDEIQQIFELCQAVYPAKMRALGITYKDFEDSVLRRIRNRASGTFSKRLVIEVEGRIVGYAHMTFTSPKEAANVESFYLQSSPDSSRLVPLFAEHISDFLAKRNIRKVVVSLNEDWKETVQSFLEFGYRPFASVYQLVKELPPRVNSSTIAEA